MGGSGGQKVIPVRFAKLDFEVDPGFFSGGGGGAVPFSAIDGEQATAVHGIECHHGDLFCREGVA